jgi:uncharacterized protein YgiM (DUF1202 family)
MTQALKSVGFDVVSAVDASQGEMKQAIAAFSEKLTAAGQEGTGLFFYAGHGVQVGGENYLIPVDAKIKREADVDLVAVSASTVLKQMEFANSAVNIIVLDACRNNPLGDGARALSRGLAKIETAPRGSFIAYSTAPGSTAADGDGVNSPYTKALAETITQPGLSIADVFQEVRTKVLASTGNQQTPWDSSSLTGRFYFKAPDATQTASVTPPPAAASAEEEALKNEKAHWDSVKDSNDPEEIKLYLAKYPNGYFVDLAKAKHDELNGAAKAASAEPTAGAATNGRESLQPSQPSALGIIAMSPQTIYARTKDAQVRAAPSKSAEVLSKLAINEEITANGETKDGKWWRVKVGDTDAYVSKTVASSQPVNTAPATTAQAAQPQGQAQTAQLETNGADEARGLEMLASVDTGAGAAPTNPAADLQAAGNVANAIQSGNAAAILGALTGAAQTQQAAAPLVQFQDVNTTVTVKKGTLIRANPVYNAAGLANVTLDTKLQAEGKAVNNLWWAVRLPNGQVGYVEARAVTR